MFKFKKLSNYGTSTSAFARTVFQARAIVSTFRCSEEQRDALLAKLFDLQCHLLKCAEWRDNLASEVESERANYGMPPQRSPSACGVVTLPGVGDLQSKGDAFLQSAKLAIAVIGDMTEPFYGKGFGHKFHQFEKWAKEHFDPADKFVMSVSGAIPFVEKIVQMRNAMSHHKSEPGTPMVYKNFDIGQSAEELFLIDPTWGLAGEPLRPMLQDFEQIIETIICLGEQILINLFDQFKMSPMLVIDEIAVQRRDPAKPTRLYVTIAGYEVPAP